jgi:hypothetical protein
MLGNAPSVRVRALAPNDTPISDDDVRFALEAFVVYHRSQFSGDHVAVADQACRRHAERSAMLQPSEWGVQESFLKMLDTLVPSLAVLDQDTRETFTSQLYGFGHRRLQQAIDDGHIGAAILIVNHFRSTMQHSVGVALMTSARALVAAHEVV